MTVFRRWSIVLATSCACGPGSQATIGGGTASGSASDPSATSENNDATASSSGVADSTETETTGADPGPCENTAVPEVRCVAAPCDELTIVETDVVVANEADLAALTCVSEIRADLEIAHTPLTELAGLENLTRVTGRIEISNNSALENIDGLCGLATIDNPGRGLGGNLLITENPTLGDLDGLRSLNSVGSHMWVAENSSLTSIAGLRNLTSVGHELRVTDLRVLADLAGLEALHSFNSVAVERNPLMRSLCGLHELTSASELRIADNPALVDLRGLDSLTTITDSLFIENNEALTTLHGLESLTDAQLVLLRDNDALVSTAALQSLASVATLNVRGNDALTEFSIPSAPTIEHVELCANEALVDAAGAVPNAATATIIYNDLLGNEDANAAADAMGARSRKIGNNAAPPHDANPLPRCPWINDSVCDEASSCRVDVCDVCNDDCCHDFGPTGLCESGSDGNDC